MKIRDLVICGMIIVFCCFCVYTYKVRTNFNNKIFEERYEKDNYRIKVMQHAISLFPEKDKNEIFFNSIREKFPNFKDEDLCKMLGYKKSKEEIEKDKEKAEENKKKELSQDTTVVEVIDGIIGGVIN